MPLRDHLKRLEDVEIWRARTDTTQPISSRASEKIDQGKITTAAPELRGLAASEYAGTQRARRSILGQVHPLGRYVCSMSTSK